jgi:purine nucleoside phosphorylase
MAIPRTIALIAGSGLAKGLEKTLKDFEEVREHTNAFGTVLTTYQGTFKGQKVIILPRHGETKDGNPQRSPAELVRTRGYEANIWHLFEQGVTEAYGFSAVGSLDRQLPLASKGVFVVPVSYGRGFAASQHSFGILAKNVHPNMSDPFNVDLRKALVTATKGAGYENSRYTNTPKSGDGFYIYNGGDGFETPTRDCGA